MPTTININMINYTVYLLKNKIKTKYRCKQVYIVANSKNELSLKIYKLIKDSKDLYYGTIFFEYPYYYVTDKYGKLLVKTETNIEPMIVN